MRADVGHDGRDQQGTRRPYEQQDGHPDLETSRRRRRLSPRSAHRSMCDVDLQRQVDHTGGGRQRGQQQPGAVASVPGAPSGDASAKARRRVGADPVFGAAGVRSVHVGDSDSVEDGHALPPTPVRPQADTWKRTRGRSWHRVTHPKNPLGLVSDQIRPHGASMAREGTTADKPYHHGDLRRAVIERRSRRSPSGARPLSACAQVARRAGVSHAAPAHHFGERQAC